MRKQDAVENHRKRSIDVSARTGRCYIEFGDTLSVAFCSPQAEVMDMDHRCLFGDYK